jgi:hypothetical protein
MQKYEYRCEGLLLITIILHTLSVYYKLKCVYIDIFLCLTSSVIRRVYYEWKRAHVKAIWPWVSVWDTENVLYLAVRICGGWRWTLLVGLWESIVGESMHMRSLFDYFKAICKTMSKYALHEGISHMPSKSSVLLLLLNCIFIVFKQ